MPIPSVQLEHAAHHQQQHHRQRHLHSEDNLRNHNNLHSPQSQPIQPQSLNQHPQPQQAPPPPVNPPQQYVQPINQQPHTALDNSGFEEVASSSRSRLATISIALPSSILNNAQSPELRMYLAGQVARAAAIYCIDEIIIFDEQFDVDEKTSSHPHARHRGAVEAKQLPNVAQFFATVLEYLDTPQYLRKHLFPVSSDLRLVGILNPLALPSHVARSEMSRWREGVAFARSSRAHKRHPHDNATAQSPLSSPATNAPPTRYVDVGLDRLVEVDRPVVAGSRVTVDMSPSGPTYEKAPGKYLFGHIVPRNTPRKTDRLYWGYRVRTAPALSGVFAGSEIAPRGYDLTIGTSERGTHISASGRPSQSFALPEFSHLLIVFGGVHGLERSVRGDHKLEELGIESQAVNGASNVGDLFDFYLNTCPQQGSRTIRTEEAILISLAALQPFLNAVEC